MKREVSLMPLTKQEVEVALQKPVTESYLYNDKPVAMQDVLDASLADMQKSIPGVTAVTALATAAVAAGAGSFLAPGAGTAAGAAKGKMIGYALATKAMPSILIASSFVKNMWKAKTQDARDFHLEKSGKDSLKDHFNSLSDFEKGVTEAMSVGYVRTGLDHENLSLSASAGNLSGAILRDAFLVLGLPIPMKGVFAKKGLGGAQVGTQIMFNMAMGVNNGIEKFNRVRHAGRTKDDAMRIGFASGLGDFAGGNIGFILMPYMSNAITKKVFARGVSGMNPIVGGFNFSGFDTSRKLTGDAMINMVEGDEKITNEFELKPADVLASFATGVAFSGTVWGAGKLMSGLGGATGKLASRAMAPHPEKERARMMADKIRFGNYKSTLDGKIQEVNEIPMTQDMFDSVTEVIGAKINEGKSVDNAFMEAFKDIPHEYANRDNILSLMGVFGNVR